MPAMRSAVAPDERVVVAIDAGKTKFLAGVFTSAPKEVERHRIEVTTTVDTLAALETYLTGVFERHRVVSIGLSAFGPLETNPDRGDFGAIVMSSEPQWSQVNLPSVLARRFGVPVLFDFDVNAAALAEAYYQASTPPGFLYLSIGTGIGGAFHRPAGSITPRTDPPQLGHIPLPKEPDDPYPGSCRFHGNCFQGLASGRAVFGRWRTPAHDLPANHAAWDLQARYLARACAMLLYSSGFTEVRVGSGISQVPGLIGRADRYLRAFMNGFPETLWRRVSGRNVIQRAVTAPDSSFIGAALQATNKLGLLFSPDRAEKPLRKEIDPEYDDV